MRKLLPVVAVLVCAGLAPAAGVVITVETLVDADVAEGQCSLREAIVAANTDAAYRECPAGSGVDRIEFGIAGTILLVADLPEITESLDLVGPGAGGGGGGAGGEIEVFIDGDNAFRPLHGTGGGSGGFALRIARLAFLRGHAADAGGCLAIPNGADLLDLRRVRFEGCTTDLDGGAINAFAASQTTIQDSTFTGNFAGEQAGAVQCWNFGALTVEDSTFSGNAAGVISGTGSGGAIVVSFVDLVLRRSTLSDNSARGSAGGLSISGISTSAIESSTIVGNSAGVSSTTGAGEVSRCCSRIEITFANTVVAGNVDLSVPGASADDIYVSAGGTPADRDLQRLQLHRQPRDRRNRLSAAAPAPVNRTPSAISSATTARRSILAGGTHRPRRGDLDARAASGQPARRPGQLRRHGPATSAGTFASRPDCGSSTTPAS